MRRKSLLVVLAAGILAASLAVPALAANGRARIMRRALEEAAEETAAEETAEEEERELDPEVLAKFSGWEYEFMSGAGGWETYLYIEEDGSFHGEYFDGDMGDTGPGYEEHGTLYNCIFTGNIIGTKELDPYSYELTLGEMIYEKTPGTEEIKDGTKFIYTEPYGLTGTDHLIAYLPGYPLAELPEGYMEWIGHLNFYTYTDEGYFEDYPEDLPFAGLYNPEEVEGFFSHNISEENRLYLGNKVKLPGMRELEHVVNEDHTYRYESMDDYGLTMITNLCFKGFEDMEAYDDESEFVRRCIKEYSGEDVKPEDMYILSRKDSSWFGDLVCINGYYGYLAGWTSGSNEDTRDNQAVICQVGNWIYMYVMSQSEYEDFFNGQAGSFYLGSLEFSGRPEVLGDAGGKEAVSYAHAYVKIDEENEGCVLADEVLWLNPGDEEMLKEYDIDPDTMANDYAIVEDDGDFESYKLAENCPIYIQYPPENIFDRLQDLKGFKAYMDYYETEERLMVLMFDEDDQVVYMYEPYTP